ncbi:MAG: sulfite exporter TauE/SafE family protein [Desulfobacterales bacterium]|nr:sulfite exporter TauE/SafE family protein [Desulfobacterales bacterium]
MGISLGLLVAIFFIALVLTMLGLGGGLIFTPLFLILGYAKTDAASVSLFLNFTAAASAAYTYARKGMVDFSLSVPLIVSSCLLAPLGALVNLHIDVKPFMVALIIVLILAGWRMLTTPPPPGDYQSVDGKTKLILGSAIGSLIGFTGGMLGIGGGVFIVPLLIYGVKTPTKVAAASSAFIVCFSSLAGFFSYAGAGAVDWGFLVPAALVCFVGGQAGSRIMSGGFKSKNIRRLFSLVLFLLCLKLIWQFIL